MGIIIVLAQEIIGRPGFRVVPKEWKILPKLLLAPPSPRAQDVANSVLDTPQRWGPSGLRVRRESLPSCQTWSEFVVACVDRFDAATGRQHVEWVSQDVLGDVVVVFDERPPWMPFDVATRREWRNTLGSRPWPVVLPGGDGRRWICLSTFDDREPPDVDVPVQPPPVVGRTTAKPIRDRLWSDYLPFDHSGLIRAEGTADLLDGHRRPLPGRPLPGMRIDVSWYRKMGARHCWDITNVDAGAFSIDGGTRAFRSFALEDWPAWLGRRRHEGVVVVHLPGCDSGWCGGCDGSVIGAEWDPGELERIMVAIGRRAVGR